MNVRTSGSVCLLVLSVVAGVWGCSSDGGGAASTTGTAASSGQGGASSSSSGGGAGGGPGSGGAGGGVGGATTASGTGGSGGAGGGCVDDVGLPLQPTPPDLLSETGLYVGGSPAPYVQHFAPQFPLWSDGANKERWAYLPKCTQIDTTDMDHWQMPVGARFWKQFTRDGVRVETRFIHRYGPNPGDWVFAAYQWDAQLTDAVRVPSGVPDANGTPHDIPAEGACGNCHAKLPERILGFGAIQLSYGVQAGDASITSLGAEGRLTTPVASPFVVPGDATAQAALGYLHANCGNCHHETGVLLVDMHLRLRTSDATVEQTDAWLTAVGKPATNFMCNGCNRIEAGDAAASAIVQRMGVRGSSAQMPPLASELVDDTGLQQVSAWIDGLPACSSAGEACNPTIGCCGGFCVNQTCVDACTAAGDSCNVPSDCCSGNCLGGACACSGDFQPCATTADCCGAVQCDQDSGLCL